jgi:hypothetical protein
VSIRTSHSPRSRNSSISGSGFVPLVIALAGRGEADVPFALGRGGGRRRRFAACGGFDGAMEPTEQIFTDRGVIRARLFDEDAHMVLGVEHGGDQIFGRRHFALAHLVEGGFAMVGERGEGLEAEHGSGALERMETAEHRIDLIFVAQVFRGDRAAPRFDLLEEFRRFRPEKRLLDRDGSFAEHLAHDFDEIVGGRTALSANRSRRRLSPVP